MIGLQMQSVAIGWMVYDVTHSTLALGLTGLFLFMPVALFSLVGGDFADRFNRKRIVLVSYFVFTLASICLTCISMIHDIDVRWIYATMFLIGFGRGFYSPSMQSILPALVPSKQLSQAINLGSSVWQTATIAGPALGGMVYSIYASPTVVFRISIGCSILAFVLISLIPYRPVLRKTTEPALVRFRAGIGFLFRHKVILGAISLDLFAVLLGGSVALIVVVAHDILNVGPRELGIMRSMPAVGAVLMAAVLSFRPIKQNAGKIMFAAVAVFGLATIVFGLSRSYALSLCALLIMGAADEISVVVRGTLVQLLTPDNMRGRVSAVSQVFIGASNELGEFESGVTAAWFGLVPAIVLGGAGTCAVALLWTKFFPALYNADKLDTE